MVSRRVFRTWLLREGFVQVKSESGHAHFKRNGVRITLPNHGPQEMCSKDFSTCLRELERVGYDRRSVRIELGDLDADRVSR